MKTLQKQIKDLAREIINDWHMVDSNVAADESDGLKLARLIIEFMAGE